MTLSDIKTEINRLNKTVKDGYAYVYFEGKIQIIYVPNYLNHLNKYYATLAAEWRFDSASKRFFHYGLSLGIAFEEATDVVFNSTAPPTSTNGSVGTTPTGDRIVQIGDILKTIFEIWNKISPAEKQTEVRETLRLPENQANTNTSKANNEKTLMYVVGGLVLGAVVISLSKS
jgi:hypothetical protein